MRKFLLLNIGWLRKFFVLIGIAFVFLISSASYCKGKEIVRFQHAKLNVLSLRKFFFIQNDLFHRFIVFDQFVYWLSLQQRR